jgi:hypothetical protein
LENRVSKGIFGPKKDEVSGDWQKQYTEELHNLLRVGFLWESQRPLGRPRRRRVDNIKMDLREMEWGNIDWLRIRTNGDSCIHGNTPSFSV